MNKFKVGFIGVSILFIGLAGFNGYTYLDTHQKTESLAEENEVCGQGEGCEISDKRVKGMETGDQIPNLELQDFDGSTTNLYDLIEGKDKFILSFAVDWCSDCERQDDKLNEYYQDLPDNYGAAVVFIDFTSKDGTKTTNKEQAQQFVEDKDYDFPTFWDEGNKITDMLGGIKATPTNLVLDENGLIKAKTEEIDMDILFLDNEEETYFKDETEETSNDTENDEA
ncbi:MAG: TlpA family protein disulfide reductase [Mycoplasmatales bacterium]